MRCYFFVHTIIITIGTFTAFLVESFLRDNVKDFYKYEDEIKDFFMTFYKAVFVIFWFDVFLGALIIAISGED